MNGDSFHPEHLDDPTLLEVSERLDALARLDRLEPDDGFESRISAATRPGVLASVHPGPKKRPIPLWATAPAMVTAACLVLAAMGLWLSKPSPTPTGPRLGQTAWSEDDMDDFLFIDSLVEEDIRLDMDISAGLSDEQPADELLFDLLGYEGGTL